MAEPAQPPVPAPVQESTIFGVPVPLTPPSKGGSDNVFGPGNSAMEVGGTDRNVLIGVGVFWGLLMVLIVLLSIGALWYIRRRRQARQDAAPQESPPAVMEDPDNWKPKQIPIIVVFPDEGYAFGWKVAHEDDEEAGGKLPDDDDDDDIKDSEPRCSSLDSFTDEGLGTPTFPPV